MSENVLHSYDLIADQDRRVYVRCLACDIVQHVNMLAEAEDWAEWHARVQASS